MDEFKSCRLCGWRCGADRLIGERESGGASETEIAYTSISDGLGTFSVTLLSCPFRCTYCNAYWDITVP